MEPKRVRGSGQQPSFGDVVRVLVRSFSFVELTNLLEQGPAGLGLESTYFGLLNADIFTILVPLIDDSFELAVCAQATGGEAECIPLRASSTGAGHENETKLPSNHVVLNDGARFDSLWLRREVIRVSLGNSDHAHVLLIERIGELTREGKARESTFPTLKRSLLG